MSKHHDQVVYEKVDLPDKVGEIVHFMFQSQRALARRKIQERKQKLGETFIETLWCNK